MKIAMYASLIVGLISLILGIISRLTATPFIVEANAFLRFTNTCFLFAISVGLLQLLKLKGK